MPEDLRGDRVSETVQDERVPLAVADVTCVGTNRDVALAQGEDANMTSAARKGDVTGGASERRET